MTAVSYVITVFNKEEYLPEVIRSLEAQIGIEDREYIFIDDGSSDRSVQVIRDCTRDLDAKTSLLNRKILELRGEQTQVLKPPVTNGLSCVTGMIC